MHDGCSGAFETGKQIVDKIRMMGFNTTPLAAAIELTCTHCGRAFRMTTMETACPDCRMVYGVTPCHSHSGEFIKAAGIGY